MASLREQVRDLEINAQKRSRQDFDPEDNGTSKQIDSEEDSASGVSENAQLGREHYESVGESKLRKPEKLKLDEKKYGGQAVSRDKIFQDDDFDVDMFAPDEDEDEDPFAVPGDRGDRSGSGSESEEQGQEIDMLDGEELDGEDGEDEEIDSEEAFEDGEEDKFRGKGFVFRGSGKDLKKLPAGSDEDQDSEGDSADLSDNSDDDQSDIDIEDIDEDASLSESEASDETKEDEEDVESEEVDEDEFTARPRPSTIKQIGSTDREKVKALIANDTATLASSLSASLSADAQKGAAVKKQYQTFDRLLDARIKLQKGLIASDDLHLDTSVMDDDAKAALQRAEEAALKLYSTIESLRHSILEVNSTSSTTSEEKPSSKKRKRPNPPALSTSSTELWSRVTTLETSSLPTRRQTLDKWSTKTRSAVPMTSASKFSNSNNSNQPDSKLTSVLDVYLQTETPKHLSSSTNTTNTSDNLSQPKPPPYTDTHFYQYLLRDLINSRATLSTSNTNTNTTTLPTLPLKLRPSGSKDKNIDTKASKGRKIRYTVHEKLENFMAGEGRRNSVGQWNDGAVREFFGSLLGQRGMLGEDVNGDDDDEDGGDGDGEVQALRLFARGR